MILFLTDVVQAQNPKPVFQHLTTKDGLSHNGITSLFQDSKGFIWIGTSDGLNRYDGKNFVTFFHTDGDSNSLASNNVGCMVEDANSNILIACSEGISVYYRSQNTFKKVFQPDSRDSKEKGVQKILFDKRGHVWVETRFEIYVLDSSFQVIKIFKDELYGNTGINNAINNMIDDKQGNIWVNKQGFLNKITSDNFTIINKENNPGKKTIFDWFDNGGIAFDSYGNSWTLENKNSILKFNSAGDLVYNYKPKLELSPNFANILITSNDKICITSASLGAFIYDSSTNNLTNYFHSASDYQSLCYNDVSCMLQDNAGNLWVGTGEGLDVLPYRPSVMQARDDLEYYKKGIAQNQIDGMAFVNHSLWIALWGTGLCRIDLLTGKKEEFETGNTDLDRMVWDVIPVNNQIWFGNFRGLHTFNPDTKTISGLRNKRGYTDDLSSIAFFNFFPDSHEHIWMSLGDANGIMSYSKKDDSFERFTQRDTGRQYFPFRHYSAIAEDNDGRLWFGYNRSYGLVTYDYHKQEFSFATHNNKPLFSYVVACLLADSSFLWIGSNNGLWKMNLKTYQLERYSRSEGLPNNLVHAIAKDNHGNFWIATDNGLAEFESRTSTFFNFSDEYDLPENEIGNCLFDSSSHRLYFTTRHNLYSFSTDSLIKKNTSVTPAITFISVMGIKNYFNIDSTIYLDYNDKYFSIEFTAPFFPSSKNNQYAYRLDGFDKDWIYCSHRQFAGYTNIPYGKYTFHLKATVNGKVWYELSHPLKIIISTPVYFRMWFLIVCIVTVAVLCLAAILIISRIKLQRILIAQNIRNKIASDLHDDIGSSLSSISFMSEIAMEKTKHHASEAVTYFEQIGERSRSTIEEMSDIVWAVNPQHDSFESIFVRMRKFSSSILEAKNIQLKFETTPGVENRKLSMEQRRNLYLIFKEIVNNMAKHAQCKQVSVVFSEEKEKIKMCISDDGIGFDLTQTQEGNGLKNLRRRSAELPAEFHLFSVPGKGTAIILLI